MATKRASTVASQLLGASQLSSRRGPAFLSQIYQRPLFLFPRKSLLQQQLPVQTRFAHTIPPPPGSSASDAPETPSPPSTNATRQRAKKQEPHYELTFTCIPCGERSTHVVSKQGYHHGSVLISCPGCRNRHVISDHLRIFGDKSLTVEDLMREKGRLVKKGTLGEDGDLEFLGRWDSDNTRSERRREEGG